MTEAIGVYIAVPVASFRVPRAREYFETLACPPPSTVYGMLLSIVGEVNRRRHEGVEIAIALLSEPDCSVVLRTLWRVKDRHDGLGLGDNRRPDFQELLTNIQLAVWVRDGAEQHEGYPLRTRVQTALKHPEEISRFGGVSLGESTFLVDDVSLLRQGRLRGRLLIPDDDGELSLPVWPDHVGSDTRWGQYSLMNSELDGDPPPAAWIRIQRPMAKCYGDKSISG